MSRQLNLELIKGIRQTKEPADLATLLRKFELLTISTGKVFRAYHDELIFLKTFPCNKEIYQLASEELKRLAAISQCSSPALYASINGDGIVFTEINGQYSLALTRFISSHVKAEFHSSEASPETVRNVLYFLCPAIEFETATQGEMGLKSRLKLLSGSTKNTIQLKWLLSAFEQRNLPLSIQEELFRQLQIYVRFITNETISRSFLEWPVSRIFYQRNSIKPANIHRLIRRASAKEIALEQSQQYDLCKLMRFSLAFLCRETDPVSYPDETATRLFDMGRGLQIALVFLNKEKRLSLESYVGFAAFKNGTPVSYGGGWIWGKRCKIGINVFPAFRGGESAWLFCRILGLYVQHFNVSIFTVTPYQFGKDNREGLTSGAYWFYYKLGFRSADSKIAQQAAIEWKKIIAGNQYRTPLSTLKHFTEAHLELNLETLQPGNIPAPEISRQITRMINQRFNGNRPEALKAGWQRAQQYWKPLVLKSLTHTTIRENFFLLVLYLSDLNHWSNAQLNALLGLFLLKQNGTDEQFIRATQKLEKLWKALDKASAE